MADLVLDTPQRVRVVRVWCDSKCPGAILPGQTGRVVSWSGTLPLVDTGGPRPWYAATWEPVQP